MKLRSASATSPSDTISRRAYVTVVPAIRTIPGVEAFDYAVPLEADLRTGDVLRVPFRTRPVPGVIITRSDTSPVADRAIFIDNPDVLLRLGETFVELLTRTAERTCTSLPTVCAAWIRRVPKRAKAISPADRPATQAVMPERAARHLVRRWHDPRGLIATAKRLRGRTLILVPWKLQADALALELSAPVLHADIPDTAAWKLVTDFAGGRSSILVATRVGAWMACLADTVLVDEPENDDFKQDELSPRFDARRVVETCAGLRPDLSVVSFSTTPRLSSPPEAWREAPSIGIAVRTEILQRRGRSEVESLSSRTLDAVQTALDAGKRVFFLHMVPGERARIACRDCGWQATCPSCSFPLTRIVGGGLCRKCGRKAPLPSVCPKCGGADLSGSVPGRDRLAALIKEKFPGADARIISPAEVHPEMLKKGDVLVVTDLSLVGGGAEDIRRRERLIIGWRRLAAAASSCDAELLVQGPEDVMQECRSWLTTDGLARAWAKELEERKAFGYPPAFRMAKLLVSGTEADTRTVIGELERSKNELWELRGPFPVPFRPNTRSPRFVIQLVAPPETPERELEAVLNPMKHRAIIDLDPIAFFS